MRLFRRSLPLEQASVRPARAEDLVAVQQLFRGGGRRFMGTLPEDLPALLLGSPAAVMHAREDVWGVMLSGWRTRSSTWLRGLALAEGIAAADGVGAMLPLLLGLLRDAGLARIYYAGDESVDRWLQPALHAHGFALDTDVVVYEKREMGLPSAGNLAVRVRPAQPVDLGTLLELDARCFDDQWTKGGEVLGPALRDTPFFVVAELNGVPCGYSFATAHFGGKLLHLVRIAVDPSVRGRGVGVRLLADLVAFAARGGAEAITLNTQSNNHRAQRLYRYFGFQPTGERQPILRYDLSPTATDEHPLV